MFRQNLSCGKQRKTRNEETLTRFFNDGSATAVEPETFLSLCYFVSFQNLVGKKKQEKGKQEYYFSQRIMRNFVENHMHACSTRLIM